MTFRSFFLVYPDIIGSRGATGRSAQEKDSRLFFGGQILDPFLRGLRWQNGSILEVKMVVNFDKNVIKNACEMQLPFSADF